MKQDKTALENPWAGLSSYEDPVKAERPLKFCGRESDTYDLTRLVDDNFIVTLYGKSGVGKTSLLNAGVFPALRREQYTPLSLRLGMTDEALSFQEVITATIEHAIAEDGGSIDIVNVVEEQTDLLAVDYLWNWFARRRFVNAAGQTTFPVVVFDQFEEVFRQKAPLRKAAIVREQSDACIDSAEREQSQTKVKADVLLAQLHYLTDESHALNDCVVDGEEYFYDFNFRFVLSIREDDLYRLEDCIDNNSLTALKRCRYRLRSLSDEGARDVILVPGEGLFKQEEQGTIVKAIVGKSRNEDGSISTNIVSLLCNRIFVDFQKTNADHITPALVDTFIKGNPFERFYSEATRGFSNKEKSYIEDHLVDSTGRRNSIPENDFLLYVPKGKQLLEGDTRILQRTSTSSDSGDYRIELIHDSFCESLTAQKEKREKRKLKIRMGIMAFCFLCVTGVGTFVWYQNVLLNKREWKMMENQARAISEKASFLVDNGNSYLARLLALEMLSSDSLNRPYTVEAERLLRDSQLKETAIVKAEEYSDVLFSPDGKRFIQGSYIWEVKSCSRILRIQSERSKEIIHQWHPSGKFYISSIGDTIKLHSSHSGKCVMKYIGHQKTVLYVSFSPNGDVMVSGSEDDSIKIWNTNSGECIRTIKHNMTNVVHFDFFRSGEQFVSVSRDSTITVWDAKSFRILKVIKTDIEPSYGCISFCPNKDVVALAHTYSSDVYFLDVKRGKLECKMGTNTSIQSIIFSKDGNSLIIGGHKGIDVYDVSKQVGINICKTASSIVGMGLSPNGRHLVAKTFNDDILYLLDLMPDTGNYLLPSSDSICFHGFFCTSDRRLIGATDGKGYLYLWNLFSGNLQKKINLGKSLFGSYLHSARVNPVDNNAVFLSSNSTAKIINLESENIIVNLEGRIDDSMFLRFCDNGKCVLGSNYSWGGTKIWDSKTGKLKCNYTNSLTTIYTDVLVPKRNLLVSVENDSNICLINIKSNVVEKVLKGHSKQIHHIRSSCNGNYLASLSVDSTLCIWDIKNGKCLHSMRDIDSDRNLIVFSDDESKIASQGLDNSIIVWDVKTGKIVSKMVGHQRDILRVDGLCFNSNGKYLLSSSKDQKIRLWDVSSGGCLKVFNAGRDMDSAFFTSDGNIIYHGEEGWIVDNYLVIPLDDLIKMTRKRFANRKLTEEEKMQYYLN